ncbi:hypothetical protein L1049_005713 [Liquidambar formosana]|uniref:Uncharacterized protein n=1 Tax=Liquidambar formosana TaxID=63359 RepID=A0AAP0RFT8_LIQFO
MKRESGVELRNGGVVYSGVFEHFVVDVFGSAGCRRGAMASTLAIWFNGPVFPGETIPASCREGCCITAAASSSCK